MLRLTRNSVLWLLLVAVLALGWAACDDDEEAVGPEPTATVAISGEFPVTLERSDGKELTIESPPQRMVVLSPGHVESLFAIGAGGQVVAVDQNSDFPPEAAAVENRLSGFEPSVEAIAGLEPDLVIVTFDPNGFVAALDNLGIPVFYDDMTSEITSIEGVLESIEELGRATGHLDQAQELVADLRERIDAVVEKVEEVEMGPRIYHELDETFFTESPDSFGGDLYKKLKAQNIIRADEGPPFQLTQEAILQRNPQVIILADAEFGQTPEVVAARPGWNVIDAVANNRVYAVDPDIVSRPGPRIVDALEALARLLYPELFPAEEGYRCLVCSAVSA